MTVLVMVPLGHNFLCASILHLKPNFKPTGFKGIPYEAIETLKIIRQTHLCGVKEYIKKTGGSI